MAINLGDTVKDRVTGFKGVAVARTEWQYGCIRITVQPDKLTKEGKLQAAETFDDPQLVVVKAGKKADKADEERRYGDRDDSVAIRR